jgi:regulator of RNase E activity RraA
MTDRNGAAVPIGARVRFTTDHQRERWVEGWVRDRGDVEALGLPMYACGEQVAGPNAQAHISAIGATVHVHGVSVAADDHLVVDANGCVRIPAGRRVEVLNGARRYEAAELLVGQALDAGEPLSSAYRHKKSMVDELRR